jgi:hypothetical protein
MMVMVASQVDAMVLQLLFLLHDLLMMMKSLL